MTKPPDGCIVGAAEGEAATIVLLLVLEKRPKGIRVLSAVPKPEDDHSICVETVDETVVPDHHAPEIAFERTWVESRTHLRQISEPIDGLPYGLEVAPSRSWIA